MIHAATAGVLSDIQFTHESQTAGGNRLIIVTSQSDWRHIKKLIKAVDIPQPQVALEILIVDLVLNSAKVVGSQTRNKSGFNKSFNDNINFQSAQLAPPILPNTGLYNALGNPIYPANALMANLLQFIDGNGGQNIVSSATPGSLIVSFNDPNQSGIWSVWQFLNQYTDSVLLSQPIVITTNNSIANISICDKRYLPYDAEVSAHLPAFPMCI